MKKRVRAGIPAVVMLLMLALTGCGGTEGQRQESAVSGEAGEESSQRVLGTNWKNSGFEIEGTQMPGTPDIETSYTEAACGSVEFSEPEFSYVSRNELSAYLRNARYTVTSYDCGGKKRFFLEKRTGWAENPDILELDLAQEVSKQGEIVCLDVISETDIALLYAEQERCVLLRLNGAGEIVSTEELTEGYQAKDIAAGDLFQGFWWCDEQGCSYVAADGKILAFDASGRFLTEEDFRGEENTEVTGAFHAPDGSLIFAVSSQERGETVLCRVDIQEKKIKELAALSGILLRQFNMQEDGTIYYSDTGGVWKWDVVTGSRERLLNLSGSDIPNNMREYIEHVMLTEEGELLLYIHRNSGTEFYVFSDRPAKEGAGIVLMDFVSCSYLKSCAASYSRAHEEALVQYETASGKDEAGWIRLMAELAAGKGPDIICLYDREKIQTLHDKGVLADLDELVPAEIREQLFPGIREMGTIEGDFIGLCFSAKPFVLATSNQIWEEEQWNYEDILQLVENNPQLEGMFTVEGKQNPGQNLYIWLEMHIEDTDFIDWEKRECSFDREVFAEVLELAKEFGGLPGCSADEARDKVREARYLAKMEQISLTSMFVELMEEYGEECHFIGFPGQKEYVGYWSSEYLIVVNRNTAYKEEAAEFLQYLIAPENLRRMEDGFATLENVVRECVYWDEWGEQWLYGASGEGGSYFTKSNGESYLEDYLDFLKKLGPLPGETRIGEIIAEEAEAYFNGTKDAGQTAAVIENRVQLYLDE